jgi:hypothetical protein
VIDAVEDVGVTVLKPDTVLFVVLELIRKRHRGEIALSYTVGVTVTTVVDWTKVLQS